jgi:phasin family protein
MQSQLVDLYRAGIRSATDMVKLSLEQTERLQQQQFQLIRSALDESMRSGSHAGDAKSLDDMVALQSRIAGAQLERMTEFWANWWRAAGDAQKSMIEQMQSQMGQARERVREGYAFTARASEEAARLAAAQLAGAAGTLREGAAVQESKSQRKSA